MRELLTNVCSIQYGYAFDSSLFSSNQGLPLVRIRDVVRGFSETYTTEKYSEDYIVHNGDMLIGMDGEFNMAKWNGGNALLNQRVCKLIPSERINAGYLFYFMPSALKAIEAKTPFVTVKHLSAKELNKVEVPLPPMEEQQQIAKVLDSVSAIIAARKQQLAELDNLIKARFVELFGEPENNDKRWPVRTLGELCSVGSSKRVYQNEQSSEGVPFWRISDLVCKMDTGTVNSELFIPEEKYSELKQAGLVPITGDILVTSRGTLGRCYIINEEDRFYFQDGMISWLSKYSNGITPLYLQHLFMMPGFRKQIDSMQAGSTVAYLSIAMLKKLQVMVPDMDAQDHFASFVDQTDKSKFSCECGGKEACFAVKYIWESLCRGTPT